MKAWEKSWQSLLRLSKICESLGTAEKPRKKLVKGLGNLEKFKKISQKLRKVLGKVEKD